MLNDCVQVGHEKKGGMKSNSHISSLGSKEDRGATNRVTECRGKSRLGMKADKSPFRKMGHNAIPRLAMSPAKGLCWWSRGRGWRFGLESEWHMDNEAITSLRLFVGQPTRI